MKTCIELAPKRLWMRLEETQTCMKEKDGHCWSENSHISCTYGVSGRSFNHVEWRSWTRDRWRSRKGRGKNQTEPQTSPGIFIALYASRQGRWYNLGISPEDWQSMPHHIGKYLRRWDFLSNIGSAAWNIRMLIAHRRRRLLQLTGELENR